MGTNPAFELTDAELELLPSAEDIAFYAENGWYLSQKLLTDDEIATLEEASEKFYAGVKDREIPARPPRLSYWTPEQGARLRQNDYVHYEVDAIGAILRKPLLGAVAAMIARAQTMRLWQATLIYKPPVGSEPSNIVPWHYDKDYWATSTSEKMLTAFIPFHDCDERIGTVCMIDGSHRWEEVDTSNMTARHFADRERDDLETIVRENARHNGTEFRTTVVEIPKGHMSFHHCRTYHASGHNLTDRPRRAISLHLQDGGNEYREFLLPDGTPAAYNHDWLVRRTADGRPDYADPEFCPTLWSGTIR
jgi:ectoine hydroxylase-related dioxygenase (phytanoyl-CoA dioxygenase family)